MVGFMITRPMDKLHRIVLPKETRKVLGLAKGGLVEYLFDEEERCFALKQTYLGCIFCGKMGDLSPIGPRKLLVCADCCKDAAVQKPPEKE